MKWEPGKVKIVAMDALPAELPYLEKGVVAKLYAQQTYQWGYRSMELLVGKVILGQRPGTSSSIRRCCPSPERKPRPSGQSGRNGCGSSLR